MGEGDHSTHLTLSEKLTSPLKANGDIHLPRQLVFPFWKNCLKSTDSFSITLENNKCKPGVPQVKATGFPSFHQHEITTNCLWHRGEAWPADASSLQLLLHCFVLLPPTPAGGHEDTSQTAFITSTTNPLPPAKLPWIHTHQDPPVSS